MGNFSAKPEHLLRSAYCEYHKSRDKKWILDLDRDSMTEYRYSPNYGGSSFYKKEWTPEEAMELVRESLKKCGKDPEQAYFVPTKSGCHIVTSPFDLQKAFEKCNLMCEGERKDVCEKVWTGPGEYELRHKKTVGWLHKDGMSLLYFNDRKENAE